MEATSRRIYITDFDLDRLRMLVRSQGDLRRPDKSELHALATDLNRAVVISAQKVVPRVITMNSRFRLKDLDTGKEEEYTLVFPGKSNKGHGKVSVLTPLGSALLGAAEQETLTVSTPESIKRVRVESILQQANAA